MPLTKSEEHIASIRCDLFCKPSWETDQIRFAGVDFQCIYAACYRTNMILATLPLSLKCWQDSSLKTSLSQLVIMRSVFCSFMQAASMPRLTTSWGAVVQKPSRVPPPSSTTIIFYASWRSITGLAWPSTKYWAADSKHWTVNGSN